MTSASNRSSIRVSMTDEQARAVLHAIANMEGDDDQRMLDQLSKVEQKIRRARERKRRSQ